MDWDASVTAVTVQPTAKTDPDAFDIRQLASWATVLQPVGGHELLLLSDGAHHLQLEIMEGSLLVGPVRLHYALSGFREIEVKTLTLRRLVQLRRLGRFPRLLFPPEPRAIRWAAALQAYDGMMTGACHREIAEVLFGKKTVCEDWSGRSDYLRLRVQRLLHVARRMVGGGYRDLLAGRPVERRGKGRPVFP